VPRNLPVPQGEIVGHAECHLLSIAPYAECVEIFSDRSAGDSKHRHTVIDASVCSTVVVTVGTCNALCTSSTFVSPDITSPPRSDVRRRHNETTASIATTSIEVPARRPPRTAVYGAFAMNLRVLEVSNRRAKTKCLDSDAQLIAAADNRIDATWVNKDVNPMQYFPKGGGSTAGNDDT
jgi:hypothetical protein